MELCHLTYIHRLQKTRPRPPRHRSGAPGPPSEAPPEEAPEPPPPPEETPEVRAGTKTEMDLKPLKKPVGVGVNVWAGSNS